MTQAAPTIERGSEELPHDAAYGDRPWVTIVWNDPVNLMSYVAMVFQKVFGYDKEKANRLMMQVHTEGKAVVSNGSREQMERDVAKLQTAGLWATLQQD